MNNFTLIKVYLNLCKILTVLNKTKNAYCKYFVEFEMKTGRI